LNNVEAITALARPASFRQRCLWLALGLVILQSLLAPQSSSAQPLGSSSSGLRGLVYTGLPLTEPELNISASAGYGGTESFAPVSGMHHRGQSNFGLAFAPLPWLAFALRLDGRLELHPDDGGGSHAAGFGDPRLFARFGHALSREWSLGAELIGWFPGADAPSLIPAATSAEARALLGFTPAGSDWVGLAAFGFRLDNSAQAAPDLSRLRLGDRISLGLSDSNAVLAALGLARHLGQSAEVFGELSADLLVGSRAPPLGQSPLRVAVGGRWFVTRALQLDLTVLTSLSARPDVGPDSPLVPIEPRVMFLLGARYGVSFSQQQAHATYVGATGHMSSPPGPELEAKPQSATFVGALVDDRGEPLPEATVKLRVAGGEVRDAITDAEGRYSFQWVPLGPASVEVSATGFQTQTWDVEVRTEMPSDTPRALVPKADSGVLRGLIRSFESEPLQAEIIVRDRRGHNMATRQSAEDGHFEIDLPPGAYDVTISAHGYKPHRRSVRIAGNGVSILNVDMREGH
jgi:hypothetical protein